MASFYTLLHKELVRDTKHTLTYVNELKAQMNPMFTLEMPD